MNKKTEYHDYDRILRIGLELMTAVRDPLRLAECDPRTNPSCYEKGSTTKTLMQMARDGRHRRVNLKNADIQYWKDFERSVMIEFKNGSTKIEMGGAITCIGSMTIGDTVYAEIINPDDIQYTMWVARKASEFYV